MNKYELAHDRDAAIAFKRYPCKYLLEKPYYDWLVPEPLVNFALNYKE